MTAANLEIVSAFETLGMSPEQIAEDSNLDITAVKAVLFQNSSLYRGEAKTDDKLQFTEDEAETCKKIIFNLAQYSEDEYLQFRSAKYVLDSKTGRLDVAKNLPTVNFNVINFNEQMAKALKAAKHTETKAIEVVSESSKEEIAA